MKKKLLSLALLLAMCLGLSVSVNAAGGLKIGKALNGKQIVTGWDGPYGSHVTIPKGVTGINTNAFQNCGISGVTIPDSVVWIGNGAFSGSALTEVTIPGCSIGDEAFINCFSLKSVNIVYGTTSIGSEAFCMCNNLTSVYIPPSVTEIGSAAFKGCSNLTSVTIPGSVRRVGGFSWCGLTRVTMQEGSEVIADGAFNKCSGLTGVYIPSSVTSIENNAFNECSGLTDIYYGGSEAQWKAIRINNKGNDALRGATIHYNTGEIPTFFDVPAESWYAEPVDWAVEMDITAGTSDTTFSPNENCTHAQILTFLWRASGRPDGVQPPIAMQGDEYYYDAAAWAYEAGMIGTDFDPNTPCTRSVAVTYMWKAEGSPSAGASGFTDVPANADYAGAVAWAVENGVTSGTSDTMFYPDNVCTRGQIVTFLYRRLAK